MHNDYILAYDGHDCASDENNRDLITQLWRYILSLEDYVIQLRVQINNLSQDNVPYPDPASDFAMRFLDHPAYDDFRDILNVEDHFERIID
jgi:hypothetical protein